MAEKLQFREKLTGILKICESKENVVLKEEVEAFFQEDNLTPEQMELVFDYLLSQSYCKGIRESRGQRDRCVRKGRKFGIQQ